MAKMNLIIVISRHLTSAVLSLFQALIKSWPERNTTKCGRSTKQCKWSKTSSSTKQEKCSARTSLRSTFSAVWRLKTKWTSTGKRWLPNRESTTPESYGSKPGLFSISSEWSRVPPKALAGMRVLEMVTTERWTWRTSTATRTTFGNGTSSERETHFPSSGVSWSILSQSMPSLRHHSCSCSMRHLKSWGHSRCSSMFALPLILFVTSSS